MVNIYHVPLLDPPTIHYYNSAYFQNIQYRLRTSYTPLTGHQSIRDIYCVKQHACYWRGEKPELVTFFLRVTGLTTDQQCGLSNLLILLTIVTWHYDVLLVECVKKHTLYNAGWKWMNQSLEQNAGRPVSVPELWLCWVRYRGDWVTINKLRSR